MLLIDALVRISAISVLLLLAEVAYRDIRPSRSWLYLVLASVSTAALFFSLTSPELSPPHWIALLFGFLNVPHLVFVWLFALSVFQTNFKLMTWHLLVGITYTFPIFWFRAFQFDLAIQPPILLTIGVAIGSILLMVHVIWVILRERKEDLIETRLSSRLVFVWILVIVTGLTALADLYLIIIWPEHASLIKAAMIWPAVLAAVLWIVRADKSSFTIEYSRSFSDGEGFVPHKDAILFQTLQTSVVKEQVYLDSGLTISSLAKDLGVTSHRLRGLINQTLGYENFNQFLNSFRVEAIRAKLGDEKNDHIPILTIALEGGFSSLAPFNKAFKYATGQTPSEYRKSRDETPKTYPREK